ncbi:MAG: hypothetical protein HQ498_09520 [Pseudohongiella sp.]|jgi:LPS-assembly lipoprotein|nr:hypothetical protein [Pseudohongiella sp.]
MSVTRIFRHLCIVGLVSFLCACGYSLRGSDVLSSKFDSVLLNSQQPNSEFSRLLRRRLEIAEVTLVPAISGSLNEQQTVLEITSEQLISRPVSVNPRARAAQYELRLSVNIGLTISGEQIIAPETLFVERSYFEDIENINGNQQEIEIIAAEMRRDLVDQLLRRLAAV